MQPRSCSFPRYFHDDPAMPQGQLASFADIRVPITAANALDELFCAFVNCAKRHKEAVDQQRSASARGHRRFHYHFSICGRDEHAYGLISATIHAGALTSSRLFFLRFRAPRESTMTAYSEQPP
jgi:hypothetical protein